MSVGGRNHSFIVAHVHELCDTKNGEQERLLALRQDWRDILLCVHLGDSAREGGNAGGADSLMKTGIEARTSPGYIGGGQNLSALSAQLLIGKRFHNIGSEGAINDLRRGSEIWLS